mgnify:CR=1 FL=1
MRYAFVLVLATACAEARAQPDGAAAFDVVFKTFMHPRCMNCHSYAKRSTGYAAAMSAGKRSNGVPSRRICRAAASNPGLPLLRRTRTELKAPLAASSISRTGLPAARPAREWT